ncbi:hypothetical protein LLE49_08850 [Alicyclobacillus tolerans]|uniref:putative amidoligase domain-containing protein n=1 Tax=Alicyclobacillus tolerans TaxID=90970 RepID=UPI001F38E217|nr:hypothetical protein [Alicyclobacillus tolerans]MCF8564837.1 hypothetical protein [Alicyclobacillus tolerans]
MAYYLLHGGQPSAKRLLKRVQQLRPYPSSNSVESGDVVIRWGVANESDPVNGRVLNPQDAVARTVSRAEMGRLLRRVGIRFLSKEQARDESGLKTSRIVRHYRIPLFDLNPIACFRSDGNPVWINQRIQRVQDSFREVSFDDDLVTKRAIRLAVRALHAVGLDFGMVSIGLGQKGVLHVLDVTANPVLDSRMLELYATAVRDFMEQEDKVARSGFGPVKLGTDIEFMLRSQNGKMVLASNFFSRKGKVGCDDRSVQFDGKRLPLVELRPDPDASPLGLLNNLREVMLQAASTIRRPGVQWRAGSMPFRPYCTGAHLHFSNVPYSSHFVKVLDNYVGIVLMMVEDPKTAVLRKARYGFLGDVRQKDYGGFEYRTPASFIVDPDVTAAALCIGYLAAVHHRELSMTDIYNPGLQTAFYKGDTEKLLPIALRNLSNLRQLPEYERFRDYIEPLVRMIEERRVWNENIDVRTVWGIPLRQPGTRKVKSRASNSRTAG